MKKSILACAVLGAALTAPAFVQAQQSTQKPNEQQAQKQNAQPAQKTAPDPIDIRLWDLSALRGGYSAERLLDTTARGKDGEKLGEVENFLVDREGRITGVIIESQGVLEVGDTHFFVPWKQVELGPALAWVQVPVEEDTLDDFSLFNDDESIYKPGVVVRGNELLNEFVRLKGGVPYGYVDDVVFDKSGSIQAIVVTPDVRYGYGLYGFPYYYGAYDPAIGYYDLPYDRDDVAALEPFDYSSLGIEPDEQLAQGDVQP